VRRQGTPRARKGRNWSTQEGGSDKKGRTKTPFQKEGNKTIQENGTQRGEAFIKKPKEGDREEGPSVVGKTQEPNNQQPQRPNGRSSCNSPFNDWQRVGPNGL